eukprot:GHVU01110095.1.p1 GENE.GHVU01110095.1~~GHVU01110095.1.p1  ORF type:complete len:398 (-),score=31.52 GHVU01110095.1:672-1751(-)
MAASRTSCVRIMLTPRDTHQAVMIAPAVTRRWRCGVGVPSGQRSGAAEASPMSSATNLFRLKPTTQGSPAKPGERARSLATLDSNRVLSRASFPKPTPGSSHRRHPTAPAHRAIRRRVVTPARHVVHHRGACLHCRRHHEGAAGVDGEGHSGQRPREGRDDRDDSSYLLLRRDSRPTRRRRLRTHVDDVRTLRDEPLRRSQGGIEFEVETTIREAVWSSVEYAHDVAAALPEEPLSHRVHAGDGGLRRGSSQKISAKVLRRRNRWKQPRRRRGKIGGRGRIGCGYWLIHALTRILTHSNADVPCRVEELGSEVGEGLHDELPFAHEGVRDDQIRGSSGPTHRALFPSSRGRYHEVSHHQ